MSLYQILHRAIMMFPAPKKINPNAQKFQDYREVGGNSGDTMADNNGH
jgi:hypothetical protein